jgi:hypothetical protein
MEEMEWETCRFNPLGDGYKLTHQTNLCGEITLPESDWRPWHSWERGSKFNRYLLTGAKMKQLVDYTLVLKDGAKIEVKNIDDYYNDQSFVSFYSRHDGIKTLVLAINIETVQYFSTNLKTIEAIQPGFNVVSV